MSGRDHGEAGGRQEPRVTQKMARMMVTHCGIDEGRSQDGIMSPNDRGATGRCGDPGRVQWTKKPSNTGGPGDEGEAAVTGSKGLRRSRC
ncbi:hypothetical protein PO909_016434 [Leuciscus waleckii]